MALPWSLRLYAVLVVVQWAYAALPGAPDPESWAAFALWLAVDAALLVLLLRGSFVAWGVLLVFTVLAALLLASGATDPSLAWGALFALTLGRLGALVAPGTRGHLHRGPGTAQ